LEEPHRRPAGLALILLFILPILSPLAPTGQAGFVNPGSPAPGIPAVPPLNYTYSIVIHGDSDLVPGRNGVTGGSGTPSDPYIIEGWTVVKSGWRGPGGPASLIIEGVTKPLVIRDVTIESTSNIYIYNSANVILEGVDSQALDTYIVNSTVTIIDSQLVRVYVENSTLQLIDTSLSYLSITDSKVTLNGSDVDWTVRVYGESLLALSDSTVDGTVDVGRGADLEVRDSTVESVDAYWFGSVVIVDSTVTEEVDATVGDSLLIVGSSVSEDYNWYDEVDALDVDNVTIIDTVIGVDYNDQGISVSGASYLHVENVLFTDDSAENLIYASFVDEAVILDITLDTNSLDAAIEASYTHTLTIDGAILPSISDAVLSLRGVNETLIRNLEASTTDDPFVLDEESLAGFTIESSTINGLPADRVTGTATGSYAAVILEGTGASFEGSAQLLIVRGTGATATLTADPLYTLVQDSQDVTVTVGSPVGGELLLVDASSNVYVENLTVRDAVVRDSDTVTLENIYTASLEVYNSSRLDIAPHPYIYAATTLTIKDTFKASVRVQDPLDATIQSSTSLTFTGRTTSLSLEALDTDGVAIEALAVTPGPFALHAYNTTQIIILDSSLPAGSQVVLHNPPLTPYLPLIDNTTVDGLPFATVVGATLTLDDLTGVGGAVLLDSTLTLSGELPIPGPIILVNSTVQAENASILAASVSLSGGQASLYNTTLQAGQVSLYGAWVKAGNTSLLFDGSDANMVVSHSNLTIVSATLVDASYGGADHYVIVGAGANVYINSSILKNVGIIAGAPADTSDWALVKLDNTSVTMTSWEPTVQILETPLRLEVVNGSSLAAPSLIVESYGESMIYMENASLDGLVSLEGYSTLEIYNGSGDLRIRSWDGFYDVKIGGGSYDGLDVFLDNTGSISIINASIGEFEIDTWPGTSVWIEGVNVSSGSIDLEGAEPDTITILGSNLTSTEMTISYEYNLNTTRTDLVVIEGNWISPASTSTPAILVDARQTRGTFLYPYKVAVAIRGNTIVGLGAGIGIDVSSTSISVAVESNVITGVQVGVVYGNQPLAILYNNTIEATRYYTIHSSLWGSMYFWALTGGLGENTYNGSTPLLIVGEADKVVDAAGAPRVIVIGSQNITITGVEAGNTIPSIIIMYSRNITLEAPRITLPSPGTTINNHPFGTSYTAAIVVGYSSVRLVDPVLDATPAAADSIPCTDAILAYASTITIEGLEAYFPILNLTGESLIYASNTELVLAGSTRYDGSITCAYCNATFQDSIVRAYLYSTNTSITGSLVADTYIDGPWSPVTAREATAWLEITDSTIAGLAMNAYAAPIANATLRGVHVTGALSISQAWSVTLDQATMEPEATITISNAGDIAVTSSTLYSLSVWTSLNLTITGTTFMAPPTGTPQLAITGAAQTTITDTSFSPESPLPVNFSYTVITEYGRLQVSNADVGGAPIVVVQNTSSPVISGDYSIIVVYNTTSPVIEGSLSHALILSSRTLA